MGTQADLAVMSELSDHGRDSRECGHYASTELASDPAAAAEARRFTRACLPLWGMEALTEDTWLPASGEELEDRLKSQDSLARRFLRRSSRRWTLAPIFQ